MQVGGEGGRPRNVTGDLAAACPPLLECDPKELELYLTQVNPVMPIGNVFINVARRQKKGA
jgi:hypothetical protein